MSVRNNLLWRKSREIQALARSMEKDFHAAQDRPGVRRALAAGGCSKAACFWRSFFPGQTIDEIVTDLLGAGLDEIAAAIPYERGPKVISRDDQGDPVYEDVGLTPRFVELTRKYKKNLETSGKK